MVREVGEVRGEQGEGKCDPYDSLGDCTMLLQIQAVQYSRVKASETEGRLSCSQARDSGAQPQK